MEYVRTSRPGIKDRSFLSEMIQVYSALLVYLPGGRFSSPVSPACSFASHLAISACRNAAARRSEPQPVAGSQPGAAA